MARLFDDALSQYLEIDSTAVADFPFTMAAWFKSDDNGAWQAIMSINVLAAGNRRQQLVANGAVGGDPVSIYNQGAGGGDWADSSAGYGDGAWHHACGVCAASDDRRAYIDGANKGTNATDVGAIGTLDRMSIARCGDSSPGNYLSGAVGEAAVWNVALTDSEAAILGLGYSPLFVRPQSLVAYWSLIRAEDQDRVGGFDVTAFNAPTVTQHMAVYYPVSPHI